MGEKGQTDRGSRGRSDGDAQRDMPVVRRLVLKIGSAVLAPKGELEQPRVEALAEQIAGVHSRGVSVVVVSSGAVASGYGLLGLKAPPRAISQKQAAAAVGQPLLMAGWIAALSRRGVVVAQALYTSDDLAKRERSLNTRRTLRELLARGVVPIVNENDTTSFAEIKLGDNDHLSALTADAVDADLLLILSTARGLYAKGDPGRVVPTVRPGDDAMSHVTGATSGVGTGGFVTKLGAAELCGRFGITTVVAGGDVPGVIARVLAGEGVGTLFVPSTPRRAKARQRWLAGAARAVGTISIDAGAARAIGTRNASLLPSGITGVRGDFARDQTVEIVGPDGAVVARGIVGYDADDVRKIMGLRATKIAQVLGYCYAEEVVHRSDMVTAMSKAPSRAADSHWDAGGSA